MPLLAETLRAAACSHAKDIVEFLFLGNRMSMVERWEAVRFAGLPMVDTVGWRIVPSTDGGVEAGLVVAVGVEVGGGELRV